MMRKVFSSICVTLICFLLTSSAAFGNSKLWESRKTVDAMTDEVTIRHGFAGPGNSFMIMFTETSGKLTAISFVVLNAYFNSGEYADGYIRFDSGEVTEINLFYYKDVAIISEDALAFVVEGMLKGKRFTVRLVDFRGVSTDLVIADLTPYKPKIRELQKKIVD